MGKSPPPKPSHDSPTASAERALIGVRLDEEMLRLHRLEAERVEAKARVEALRGELGTFGLDRDVESGGPSNPPRTAFEKVMLFRQLFRGREDLMRPTSSSVSSLSSSARWLAGASCGTRKPVRYHFDGAIGSTSSA
jgi:hypothetical protein